MTILRVFRHFRYGMAGAIALGLLASNVHAQPATPSATVPATLAKPAVKSPAKSADKPVWSQLSPAQQLALEPLRAEWDPMEGVRKQKWLELANRYAAMKPEEQQRVHERMREWVRLTPAQRKVARDNYSQAKTISPNEKSATWESYKQLPDDQKQKLAEQAKRKQLTNLPPAKSAPRSLAPSVAPLPAPSAGIATSSTPVK